MLTSEWRWVQLQSVVVARGDARRVGACFRAANLEKLVVRGSALGLGARVLHHRASVRDTQTRGRVKETGEEWREGWGEGAGNGMQRQAKSFLVSFP
jgi:hypothetical protein